MRGSQGHAGTVPMSMRHDPVAGAAEAIVLLESLFCTVGEISTWTSAINVIPGQVTFTVDLRATDDMGCEAVVYELSLLQLWGKATHSLRDKKTSKDTHVCI